MNPEIEGSTSFSLLNIMQFQKKLESLAIGQVNMQY